LATKKPKQRLVFVGGGHAHLYSLKRLGLFLNEGIEVMLVGPDRFHYYSGMGPGLLSGIYRPEQVRFDVQRLVEPQGGRFIQGKVASIDAARRTLGLESGETVSYDRVSFNTGSRVPVERIQGADTEAIPVKPVANMESVHQRLIELENDAVPKILVLGGGPAGVELAANVWRLMQGRGAQADITLSDAGDRILARLPEKASGLASQSLTARSVRIVTGFEVSSLEEGVARSVAGDEIPYDLALLTTGIVPHEIYAKSGLATSEDGALLVNDCLQSPDHPEIFGGGDCISLRGRRLDRVGVYAVREGPVLFKNLMANLSDQSLERVVPQEKYLLILNLGDGTGLMVWKSWVLRGRWAFRWKNYLDTSFMFKYQASGEKR
jgi:NADH dehydrogenase FAD-containing subunit